MIGKDSERPLVHAVVEALTGPPTVCVRELDRWATRHREPDDLIEGPHPVTDALSGE